MARYEASLDHTQSAPTISRRAYNALTFGLVTVAFLIMWGMYLFVSNGGLATFLGGAGSIGALVVYLIGTIGGIALMRKGKSDQSVPTSLVGFFLFAFTFSGTLGLALTRYNVGTITYAFGITACLSGIFLIAGVTFPEFFSKIGGVLCVSLIGVIIAELIATFFFHANQTIFDYIIVLIFCGFLGFDSYRLSLDQPTVPNAIWYASDIFIDIANILVRVLSILDRD